MGEKEEETMREIEVRSLSGESTKVRIPATKSVNDLKLLLPPLTSPPTTAAAASSSSSPDFHLYFKGVKLSLQCRLELLDIKEGEFLVLVPFIKKDRLQNPKPDLSTNVPKKGSISRFADSAHSDMMQEFSSLFDKSGDASGQPNCEDESFDFGCKRKRDFGTCGDSCVDTGGPHAFIWNVLQTPNKCITQEQNSEKFVEILKSLNCLANSLSGKCIFLAREVCKDKMVSCMCPPWLKRIMEAFSFLNIFSAFCQVQGEEITLSKLKEALTQLGEFGCQASFEDIERLCVLCPKVVSFANHDPTCSNPADGVVIISCGDEVQTETANNPINGRKGMSLSKAFSAMRKRETSCKSTLLGAVKFLMPKSGNENAVPLSLEGLIKFMNEGGTKVSKKEGYTDVTFRQSSSPSAFRQRCCVWRETNQLLPLAMIQHLREGIGSNGQIVHVEDIGAKTAKYVEVPHDVSDRTKSALKCMGITKLYSHQAESIIASLAGKNVVVSTTTSSGKSLCYNVPVLEVLSQNLSSCALYLFPTKALAQDQLRALLAITKLFDININIGVYDGDTSQKDRVWLRDSARLLITNPDMLHMSILPFHRQFSRILTNLRFVVIDEAHVYKGAFGCHTALILRRLRRLCSHVYGSDPSFVFSTATSANPLEHCMELAHLSTLELINNDGSPSAQKLFVLWNPASCLRTVPNDCSMGMDTSNSANRSLSPISEVSHLFAEMVQHGLRCIAFCRSRKLTEIVLSYTREILQKIAPHLADSVCAYRAGYLAEDRRKIERDFFSGKLCGIAATNALELGIDVGHIDATLHLGFPGSIASLWQQAGRSGRRDRSSLGVYVAFEGPVDQYFMKFPEKLFRGPIECCHIDAQNQQVLEQHLICAALEHPLSLLYDEKFFGSSLEKVVMSLRNKGDLSSDPSHDSTVRIWTYIGREKIPSRGISIRAIDSVRYSVIDMKRHEVLEEIEESRAFFQVYEGAIYMHQGKTYLVKELNISEKIAWCDRTDVNYYTKTRDYTDIHVLGGDIVNPARISMNQSARTTAQANSCRVTTTWFGFCCIQKGTHKVLDTVELSLPKYSYESQAVWIRVPQSTKQSVEKKFSFRRGLHAASHAVLNVVPLFIRCNSSDLAPECPNPHDTRYYPERILVYDQHPGGTGVSKQIQPFFTELLGAALELLTSCRCFGDLGCPNCVQSLVCHEYNEEIHKDAAIMIIKGVLDAEKSYFEEGALCGEPIPSAQ